MSNAVQSCGKANAPPATRLARTRRTTSARISTASSTAARVARWVRLFRLDPPDGRDGLHWDLRTLDAYIENPYSLVSGTRMAYPGLEDPEDRADLIAFIRCFPISPGHPRGGADGPAGGDRTAARGTGDPRRPGIR
jgi:hypothetical protein